MTKPRDSKRSTVQHAGRSQGSGMPCPYDPRTIDGLADYSADGDPETGVVFYL